MAWEALSSLRQSKQCSEGLGPDSTRRLVRLTKDKKAFMAE